MLQKAFNVPVDLLRKIKMAENAKPTREVARLSMDCLDLTSLKGNESREEIYDLCDTAKHNLLSSVCIYPPFIPAAKTTLKKSDVIIATVINFPYGNKRTLNDEKASPKSVREDVTAAIKAGARQIDIVLAHEEFRDGNIFYAQSLLMACRAACTEGVTMKVIVESASFDSVQALRAACKLAINSGADCLKTSTGKHPAGGADLGRTAILLDEAYHADRAVGVKVAGGIGTLEQCAHYITLCRSIMGWNAIKPKLFRIGGSSLMQSLINGMTYAPLNEPDLPAPRI